MSLSTPNQHSMVITRTHDDGSQEWVCPTCGRHILMQWSPEYKRTVLEPGDLSAAHLGSSGGLHIGGAAVAPVEPETLQAESLDLPVDEVEGSDPYLTPWMIWLDGLNF